MNIVTIDSRETDLIQQFKNINYENFEAKQIPLGDILFGNIIIERKTWNDLASSIIDKRYVEQGKRLMEAKEQGYCIYYIIEGNLDLYKPYGIKKETLISCVFSLTYEKNIFVILTKNINETMNFIIQFRNKYIRLEQKDLPKTIIQKKKNSQITLENISECMLCQIPNISLVTSKILLEHFGNLQTIYEKLKINETLFEDFTYTKDGKSKKLNKRVIEHLNQYLRK